MDDPFDVARQVMSKVERCSTNAVPEFGVYLVTYLNEDGDLCRLWHLEGEPNLDTIMGIVEMFKLRIAADTYEWDDD